MFIPGLSRILGTPFKSIAEYNEKLKELAWAFQQAFECYVGRNCATYRELSGEVDGLKTEVLEMNRSLKLQLTRKGLMPVKKALLLGYMTTQHHILSAMDQALRWMICRPGACLPEELVKQLFLLVDAIIDPIEELIRLTAAVQKYFKSFAAKHRQQLMEVLQVIEQQHEDACRIESHLQRSAFSLLESAADLLYVINLSQKVRAISQQTLRAGDAVQVMLLR